MRGTVLPEYPSYPIARSQTLPRRTDAYTDCSRQDASGCASLQRLVAHHGGTEAQQASAAPGAAASRCGCTRRARNCNTGTTCAQLLSLYGSRMHCAAVEPSRTTTVSCHRDSVQPSGNGSALKTLLRPRKPRIFCVAAPIALRLALTMQRNARRAAYGRPLAAHSVLCAREDCPQHERV